MLARYHLLLIYVAKLVFLKAQKPFHACMCNLTVATISSYSFECTPFSHSVCSYVASNFYIMH